MSLFKTPRVIASQIDEFFDTVAEGILVYRAGVNAYLDGDQESFDDAIAKIDVLESKADKISGEVEANLYSRSLIPEHRGDVLGLLENTDNIIDTAKSSLYQFSVERPQVPEQFASGYRKLAEAGYQAADALVIAARTFFRNPEAVKDSIYKVNFYETEADQISDRLKRAVFDSDLDLAHKIHLRYFALNIDRVSDAAEHVAHRLAIYAIKRTI